MKSNEQKGSAKDAITLLRRIKSRDLTNPGRDAEGDWYADWQLDQNAAHVRLSTTRRLARHETASVVLQLTVAKFSILKAEHNDVTEFHLRIKNETTAPVLLLDYAADGSERWVAA